MVMDVNQTYNHFLIHTNVIPLYIWNQYNVICQSYSILKVKFSKPQQPKKKKQKHQNKTSPFRFRQETSSFETQIYKTCKASGFGAGLR